MWIYPTPTTQNCVIGNSQKIWCSNQSKDNGCSKQLFSGKHVALDPQSETLSTIFVTWNFHFYNFTVRKVTWKVNFIFEALSNQFPEFFLSNVLKTGLPMHSDPQMRSRLQVVWWITFCVLPKNAFCTPFLSTESVHDTQMNCSWRTLIGDFGRWIFSNPQKATILCLFLRTQERLLHAISWFFSRHLNKLRVKNFECRIWTSNLLTSTKSNSFTPFVAYPRTPFARHFFQQNLFTTFKQIVHEEFRLQNLDFESSETDKMQQFCAFLAYPRTPFARHFLQHVLFTRLKSIAHEELRLQNLDVDSFEIYKKQQFFPFCGEPKNNFCTPFVSTGSVHDTKINCAWRTSIAEFGRWIFCNPRKATVFTFMWLNQERFLHAICSTESIHDMKEGFEFSQIVVSDMC